MATSERVLTPIAPATDVPRAITRATFIPRGKPVWKQAALDFLFVSLGLMAGFTFSARTAPPQYTFLSPWTLAAMVTTVLAFTGAYPRHNSPLDIATTQGLVRGLACAALLLGILCIDSHSLAKANTILIAAWIGFLLLLRREATHIVSEHRAASRRNASRRVVFDSSPEDGAAHDTGLPYSTPASCIAKSNASFLLKRGLDVVLGTVVLVLFLPFGLLVALLVKIDSRGPALIRQRRIGENGETFEMWKFRSMHAGVPRYARSPISDSDPRLTRVGRGLRRFSIDELPQILNVLKGDMSLVGPRPEMPFIVEQYSPHERLRLHATPGITGLWQISPARAMPIHKNLGLDLFYIENRNIFLDLAILLRTAIAVFRGIGAT